VICATEYTCNMAGHYIGPAPKGDSLHDPHMSFISAHQWAAYFESSTSYYTLRPQNSV